MGNPNNRPLTIHEAAEIGSQRRPELRARLWRAVKLIEAGNVIRISGPKSPNPWRSWTVHSLSAERAGAAYSVDREAETCACPDFRGWKTNRKNSAPGGWCKHRLAVEMLLKVQRKNGYAPEASAAKKPPRLSWWHAPTMIGPHLKGRQI